MSGSVLKEMCSICSGDFKEPKILECKHSFCQNCLADHVDKTSSDGHFPCPLCQRDATLPEGGVKNLPSKSTSDVPRCQGMKVKCSNPCEFKCLDCDHYLCRSCRKIHNSLRICKHHKIVGWNEDCRIVKDKKDLCPCSRKKVVEFLCSDCNKSVCSKCCFNDHNGHTLKDLQDEDVRQQIEDDIVSSTTELESYIEKLEKSLETRKGEVTDLKFKIFKIIDSQVLNICREVVNIGDEMKKDAEKMMYCSNENFDGSVNIEKSQSNLKNLEDSKEKSFSVLEEGSIVNMMERLDQLKQEVEDCRSREMVIPEIPVISFEAGEINVNILKKQVGKIIGGSIGADTTVLEEYAIILKQQVHKIIRAFKLAYLTTDDEQED